MRNVGRFGLARWIWFGKLTRLAWLLTLRDGYPTTDLAWRAAIGAVDRYGTARAARKAIRTGRPVPRPEPLNATERDEDHQEDQRDTAVRDGQRDIQARHDDWDTLRYVRRDATADDPGATGPGRVQRDVVERDAEPDPAFPDRVRTDRPSDGRDDPDKDSVAPQARADAGGGRQDDAGQGGVGARMLAYARQQLARGVPITGADLDRQFGTRDYGRKVLRRLATDGTDS